MTSTEMVVAPMLKKMTHSMMNNVVLELQQNDGWKDRKLWIILQTPFGFVTFTMGYFCLTF
jgi:hypothetical protein